MRCRAITLLAVNAIIASSMVSLRADEDLPRVVPPSKELIQKLTDNIKQHCPDAKIEITERAFTAKHGTMIFTVHGHSMDGAIQRKTHEEEGPNHKGFLLEISLEDGQYAGQASVPQTLREPYWQRFIDAPSTEDGKKYHRINFSYGRNLDPKLKQAIFDTIPKVKAAVPDPQK